MNEGAVIEMPPANFSRREERELPAVQVVTPMSMLAVAVQKGMDVATIAGLMDLQDRWEKGEAKKAYTVAMAEFKANAPLVSKDKDNKQYDSKYTSIGNLVNTVNPHLSQFGLSARWDIDQSSGIKVTCIMTHRLGHSEATSMSGPPDTSGKKNPLQEIKSTITYLKAATFEAITGLASADGSDDDGNGSGNGMPDEEFQAFAKRIKDSTTKEKAKAVWQEGVKAAQEYKDLDAANKLKEILLEHSKFIDSVKP